MGRDSEFETFLRSRRHHRRLGTMRIGSPERSAGQLAYQALGRDQAPDKSQPPLTGLAKYLVDMVDTPLLQPVSAEAPEPSVSVTQALTRAVELLRQSAPPPDQAIRT